MYLSYYRLEQKPFQISADPHFLWLGEKHKEALATLKYGILDNRGFLLLTGDVGTGKTTLINALVASLGADTVVATIPDPGLDRHDLFRLIAHAFDLDNDFDRVSEFIIAFKQFLLDAHQRRQKVLLIIDEAQRLRQDLLEEIRLLSNIEMQHTKLINIFFVGQNEFVDILLQSKNRAIRQRITINYHIEPLSADEVGAYIDHRLDVAGCKTTLFKPDAVREIFRFSEGFPRLINIICDHALLTGYVKGVSRVNAAIINECAKELRLVSPQVHDGRPAALDQDSTVTTTAAHQSVSSGRLPRWALACLLIALLVAVGGFAWLAYEPSYQAKVGSWLQALRKPSQSMQPPASSSEPASQPDTESVAANAGPPEQAESSGSSRSSDPSIADKEPDAPGAGQASAMVMDDLMETPMSEAGESGPNEPLAASAPSEHFADEQADQLPIEVIPAKRIIPFDFDTNDLAPSAYVQLDQVIVDMQLYPQAQLLVTGYTDDSGGESYNQRLSQFRANIVKTYLVGKGIAAERIEAFGAGAQNPIASNATDSGRKANRRVEIEWLYGRQAGEG